MGRRKEFIGTVISDRMSKTAVVRITRVSKHPRYGRMVKKYAKFKVHDPKNTAKMGDVVRIRETRPISKEKNFRLIEVVKKSAIPHIEIKEDLK